MFVLADRSCDMCSLLSLFVFLKDLFRKCSIGRVATGFVCSYAVQLLIRSPPPSYFAGRNVSKPSSCFVCFFFFEHDDEDRDLHHSLMPPWSVSTLSCLNCIYNLHLPSSCSKLQSTIFFYLFFQILFGSALFMATFYFKVG